MVQNSGLETGRSCDSNPALEDTPESPWVRQSLQRTQGDSVESARGEPEGEGEDVAAVGPAAAAEHA